MGIDIVQLPAILMRRWLYVVVTALVCAGLAAGYVVTKKPVFSASTDLLIDPQGLAAAPADPNLARAGGVQDQGMLESQLYVVQSREVLNQVVDKLGLRDDRFINPSASPDRELALVSAVAGLQKNMTVEREGQSFVMTLTVKHRDVNKAAEIANTIALVYLNKLHESRSDASSRAAGAFELQAKELAEKLRRAEEELEKFKGENNLVSTGQQGLVIDQQVEGVNKQLIAARADLEVKRASYNQIKSLTVGSIAAGGIPEALASTSLSTMRSRYADMASNADQLATTLGANHPQMRAARSQVEGMREAMEQELARIRQSAKSALDRAEANTAALQGRLDSLTASSLDTSEAGIRARALQSEVETLRALYKTMLSRASELGQRDTVNINNSRVISKAVPTGASSLVTKLLVIIAGGLFGIAAGSGLAVLRELLSLGFGRRSTDVVIDNPAPAIAATATPAAAHRPTLPRQLPVIAHIPASAARRPTVSLSGGRFVRAEAEPDQKSQIGVSRTVDALLKLPSGDRPSLVLMLPADNDNPSGSFIPDVAGALNRLSKDVIYSAGDRRGHDAPLSEPGVPLADLLKFNRLSAGKTGKARPSAPTFNNFARNAQRPDYVLIDAGGATARNHLAELLEQAHGILLLADGADGGKKLEELVGALEPWRERMLGTVLFDRAA